MQLNQKFLEWYSDQLVRHPQWNLIKEDLVKNPKSIKIFLRQYICDRHLNATMSVGETFLVNNADEAADELFEHLNKELIESD